jgi:UDP-glucose 4-epimerase
LIAADHEVTVIDSLVSGHLEAIHPDAEFVRADIRDEQALGRLFAAHSFHAVINYGGYIQAGESVQQPGRYFANNIGGTIALLNAMVQYGVLRFVFSSSAGVYGNPDSVPVVEDAPKNPVSPYGLSKKIVEDLLPWYEQAFGMRYAALRYFSMAPETRGEDHRPDPPHPIVLDVARQAGQDRLYGIDYPTPDGTCIRDYVPFRSRLRPPPRPHPHEIASGAYNLGIGRGFQPRGHRLSPPRDRR